MTQLPLNSRSESFVICSLFAGSIALCATASSAWGWVGGMGAWGMGEALRSRRKMEYSEVWSGALGYSQDAIGDLSVVTAPITRKLETEKVRLVVSALKQLPLGDRIADSFIAQQGLSTDWFEGFEQRSAIVCGESGDGKSYLLNWRVQRFLQTHPEGILHICDPDYGSSHAGSEPNIWLGLPVGPVVQIETADILNTILEVSDVVSDRAKRTATAVKNGDPKPAFKPLLLVIDEWVSLWDSLDDSNQGLILKALTNIINRGLKQGHVTFIAGLHDLSVGSSGMPQSLLRKVEILLLHRAAQSERNYSNLDVVKKDRDAAIAKLQAIPRVVKKLRPVVVFTDKTLSVRALPHLEVTPIELVAPTEPIDPDQVWLDEVWTAELEFSLVKLINDRILGGKQPIALSESWQKAGQSQRDQRKENPRYILFRDRVENLATRLMADPLDSLPERGGKCPETEPPDEVTE